jgi:hypothetical protein
LFQNSLSVQTPQALASHHSRVQAWNSSASILFSAACCDVRKFRASVSFGRRSQQQLLQV